MSNPKPFKVGDKVKTNNEHNQCFGSHEEGIIERIDRVYIKLCTKTNNLISLHVKWIEHYEGNSKWFYKGKLV